MKPRVIALALSFAALAAIATAQRRPSEARVRTGTHESMLVSTDWLARHLSDPDLVVLHIGRQRADYDKGHIPGARFIALSEIAVTRDGIPNELPPVADLKKSFEAAGVSDSSRVILYGDMAGLYAARAYFTLDYLGHVDRAALLDGGFEKWKSEQRPLSTEAPEIKVGTFTPNVHPEVLVELAAVRNLSRQAAKDYPPDSVLVDARPPEDFSGANIRPDLRSGHIPGAVSLYWLNTVESKDNPELLPPADLRKVFAKAGIKPGQKVITYCVSGIQASFLYFAARYVGYDAALYDGSMSEWSKAPETEVVTAPR